MSRVPPFEVPGVVRIRGREWPVLRESDLGDSKFDRKAKRVLRTSLGVTWYPAPGESTPHEIHLRKHRSRRAEAQSFLHEALHACALKRRGKRILTSKQEEAFIRCIEVELLHLLEQLRWVNEPSCTGSRRRKVKR